jgi:hypothetical protein
MKEQITLDRKDAEEIAEWFEEDLHQGVLLEPVVPLIARLAQLLRDKLAGRIE